MILKYPIERLVSKAGVSGHEAREEMDLGNETALAPGEYST